MSTESERDKASIERMYEERADQVAPRRSQQWTWEQEGTSVLVSVDDETGDRCYFHCTNERNAKAAVESHNAAIAVEHQEFVELDELYRGVCQDYYSAKIETDQVKKQLAAEREGSYKSGYKDALDCNIEAHTKPLVDALKSIAANTCCDKCQEAALVAKSALAKISRTGTA